MSGSLWRKWDLHFHSQTSFDYKDKSITNQQIIEGLISHGIEAVAITDHHKIDIERIKDFQKIGGGRITVFPGIEFISNLGGSESIHFIGIFSDKCDIDHVWTNLQAKCGITQKDIDDAGGDQLIYVNMETTSDLIHELGGIVTVHAGGKSNSLESIRNNQDFKRKIKTDLTKKCIDVFECGAVDDLEDYNTIVFPGIKMIRPLIICSDNHKITDYVIKENLWIKADTNFEGLKQILFEPLDRVRIQFDKPEQKKPYHLIKEVRFIDNSGENYFDKSPISINPNLNTIIGGKSSGKSLLLYHIARTIDEDLVNKLIDNKILKKYDYEGYDSFDFEVTWESGDKNLLSNPSDKRKIIYIPQAYLSKLSDDNLSNRKTLNQFIKNLLLEDEELLKIYQKRIREIRDVNNDIQKDCHSVTHELTEVKNIGYKLKEVGNSKGLTQYLSTLEEEISKLKKASGLTSEEIKQYDKLVSIGKGLRVKDANLLADKENIEEFDRKLNNTLETIKMLISEHENRFETEDVKKAFLAQYEFLTNLQSNAKIAKETLLNEGSVYENIKRKIDKELDTTIKDIKPLLGKFKLRDQITRKEEIVKKENAKLIEIKRLNKEIEEKKKSISTYISRIKSKYKEKNDLYQTLVTELSVSIPDPDLTVSVNYHFDTSIFNEVLSSTIYKQSLKSNYLAYNEESESDAFNYVYSRKNHTTFIDTIIDDLISGKTKIFKGQDLTTALIKILQDNYFVDFGLTYKGDILSRMSPGKKNLALLKILIELSKEEWPILIDQPEDELDNRSIYRELVEFLRTKKKTRQILAITHNPNVVISADSENVIIANQAGQEKGANNEKFKFEYRTGSLENTNYDEKHVAILKQMTIKNHVCEILEGGKEAFYNREKKYDFKK